MGAEDGDETVITQAGFGQDVLSVGEDYGRGVEGGRSGGGEGGLGLAARECIVGRERVGEETAL